MGEASLFQKHCEKALGHITGKYLEDFEISRDAESRINILYDISKNIPIQVEHSGKNIATAEDEKNNGNKFFAKKDYSGAIKSYNKGIIACPQDTDVARELLTILISNRSATYFELKEYKRVFNDIDYLLEIGNYPAHLQYKIWLRKAKCYIALQNERSAEESFNAAIESLKHSKLDDKDISSKINEIETARKKKPAKLANISNELVPIYQSEIFVGGNEYISAHPKVTFQQDSVQGRYAVAQDNIEAGTILVEENPHCMVIKSEFATRNCQNCAVSVDQPIACTSCGHVVFCSTNCQRQSCRTYHKIECNIQKTLYHLNASVNCLMALRIITQKPLNFFKDKRNKLKDYLRDGCKKNIIRKKTYRPDDYDNVFFLCRNEHLRPTQELLHFTLIAIYLLRLLKLAGYFNEGSDETLSDDEKFIGGLILRHLEILQFNAHEISELQNKLDGTIRDISSTIPYGNEDIGAALYPTLALFNHSCDPSIVRYNVKNRIVVRAIKPIKSGETIYENYGPMYSVDPIEYRQQILKSKYWFECLCLPCVDLWPTMEESPMDILRIPCKTSRCPFVFEVHGEEDPFLTCDYCHNMTSIIPHLKGLMTLQELIPQAETLYGMGDLENALKIFLEAVSVLYKFSKPPHSDIINVQQRIRVCMVHQGNKCYNYKPVNSPEFYKQ